MVSVIEAAQLRDLDKFNYIYMNCYLSATQIEAIRSSTLGLTSGSKSTVIGLFCRIFSLFRSQCLLYCMILSMIVI